jgi:hypothetical protein
LWALFEILTNTMLNILIVFLPSFLVILVVLYLFKSYLNKQFDFAKTKNQQEILFPLKLQAYERLTLFLERIKPNNLILRLDYNGFSATDFHKILITEISNELNHNLAQQIYINPDTWNLITLAVNSLKADINGLVSEKGLANSAKELSLEILKNPNLNSLNAIDSALLQLKKDIQEIL